MASLPLRVATSPTQFAVLAQLRYREAIALLRERQRRGALYLGGYVVECSLKAVLAKKKGRGCLPPEYQNHDIPKLVSELLPLLKEADAAILIAVPQWSHLLRYCCNEPRAELVVEFLERAKEAHRCLSTYL